MDPRELLAAIVASPDDDAPRRVYADALLDAGDPQGELIHLQCELAAGGLTRAEAVARRRRERELLETHAARWTSALDGIATRPVFRRGFVDEVHVDPWMFPNVGERLFRDAPLLRGVTFEGVTENGMTDEDAARARVLAVWQKVISCPAFGLLRGVGLGELGYDCRVFGEVTPGWESVGDEALVALLATDARLDSLDACNAAYRSHDTLYSSPPFQQLTRLAIRPDNLGDSQALFEALVGSRMRSLSVSGEYLGPLKDAVLSTLTELRIESMDLDLDWAPAGLERFAFSTTVIRDEQVDRATACARNVRELCLDGERVPGWGRLAAAELPHLRVLRVHGNDVGTLEAEAMLQMAPCAAQLELLQLRRIHPENRAALEQRFGVAIDTVEASTPTLYWR